MNPKASSAYLQWATAHQKYFQCPVMDVDDGPSCGLPLDEFTSHTKLCPVHGAVNVE